MKRLLAVLSVLGMVAMLGACGDDGVDLQDYNNDGKIGVKDYDIMKDIESSDDY